MSRWFSTVGVIALLGLGCAPRAAPEVCESHEVCRGAFGLGWQCRDDGYCESAEPDDRCEAVWPVDLFEEPERYADAVVIGGLFDLRREQVKVRAAELAVRQVQEEGGLDGRQVALIQCDVRPDPFSDPRNAAEVARWLVDAYEVQALVGLSTAEEVREVHGEVALRHALILSPSVTSTELGDLDGGIRNDGNPGLFWRTVPSDTMQGSAMVSDLLFRGQRRIALVYPEDAYGEALAERIEQRLSTVRGGSIHRHPFQIHEEITDAFSAAMGEEGVQEILFLDPRLQSIREFLKAAESEDRFLTPANYPEPPPWLFLVEGGPISEVVSEVDPALHAVLRGSRRLDPSGPVYDTFVEDYLAVFPDEEEADLVDAPFTYDATWLALYGTAWSWIQEGRIHGLGIGRGLRRVSGPSEEILPVGPGSWAQVQGAFSQALPIDVQGASGELNFDPVLAETTLPYEIWVILGGVPEGVRACDQSQCFPYEVDPSTGAEPPPR